MVHLGSSTFMKLGKCQPTCDVVGFPISALSFNAQISLMMHWAHMHQSKAVYVSNVHMLMEGQRDEEFSDVLSDADLLTPDGMPLVWVMRCLSNQHHERVAGMDILLALCDKAQAERIKIFFLGSTPTVLTKIQKRLDEEFPMLEVAGLYSLPFRPLTPAEDKKIIQQINASGAGIVFVSLGCPKQEKWINQHKDSIQSVMIGLGGAFSVYAGIRKWAPKWVRDSGLEWLYRLLQEPKRLWRRYITTIPSFLLLATKQIIELKLKITPTTFHEEDKVIDL